MRLPQPTGATLPGCSTKGSGCFQAFLQATFCKIIIIYVIRETVLKLMDFRKRPGTFGTNAARMLRWGCLSGALRGYCVTGKKGIGPHCGCLGKPGRPCQGVLQRVPGKLPNAARGNFGVDDTNFRHARKAFLEPRDFRTYLYAFEINPTRVPRTIH